MKRSHRRSWLLTLTVDDRKVEKAAATAADVLILDLSDSVPPDLKDVARRKVTDWFAHGHPFGDKELVIKPNSLRGPWGRADLDAVAGLPAAAIYYPETRSAEEVQIVADALDAAGSDAEIAVLLEEPRAFFELKDIARVRRVTTLCHAQGDLSKNLGATLTDSRETLLHTASQTVLAARAFGLDSIDTIIPSDLRNLELAQSYAAGSKRLGFTACSTYYAPHIPAINTVFTPSAAELDAARNLIAAYEQALAQGLAAYAGPDGRAVTIHQYDQAKALLQTFG